MKKQKKKPSKHVTQVDFSERQLDYLGKDIRRAASIHRKFPMKIPEETKRILCCCTGGKDRSPIMAEYFLGLGYEAKAVGINEHKCKRNGTSMIDKHDLAWCDFIVCVSTVHEAYVRGMLNVLPINSGMPIRIVNLADHPAADDPKFRELVLAKMRGAFEK